MANPKRNKFEPEVCECCKQTKNYALALDRGTALIILAIYNAVRRKNENKVHIQKEMVVLASDFPSYRDMVAGGFMTSIMWSNVSRARYHGLVAFVDGGGDGEYLITKKGAKFLRGERIPRTAIIDKATGHKSHYLEPETDTITFAECMKRETPFWDLTDIKLRELAGDSESEPASLFS